MVGLVNGGQVRDTDPAAKKIKSLVNQENDTESLNEALDKFLSATFGHRWGHRWGDGWSVWSFCNNCKD